MHHGGEGLGLYSLRSLQHKHAPLCSATAGIVPFHVSFVSGFHHWSLLSYGLVCGVGWLGFDYYLD